MLKRAAVLALVLTAAACTRKVAVESEPTPMQSRAAAMNMVGSYAYDVNVDGQVYTGLVGVTRPNGSYDASMTVNEMPGHVQVSDVRVDGTTMTMKLETPGGPGTAELEWQDADHFKGLVYMGGSAYPIKGTRKQ